MKLHYAGYQPGASGFGWATCNANLYRELSELCTLVDDSQKATIWNAGDMWNSWEEVAADVAFIPLEDHELNPVSYIRAQINFAYTFFESALGPNAAANAKKYNTVFCGSSWCLERIQEAGITNGKVLIQGVDHDIFKTQPPRNPDGQFRIFSGGKFEYRKGQDLVIAAFKEFALRHDDAHLVCSWFNPWPQLIGSFFQDGVACKFSTEDSVSGELQEGFTRRTLARNEIDASTIGPQPKQATVLTQLYQENLAEVMANTDVGLFPNRCEGGTNLVLMEYASVGRKIIANSKTGHADISGAISYEIPATTDENHWAVQEVDDIVAMLELAYENRDTPEHWSKSAYSKSWTWEAAAETIVAEAQRLL